MANVVIKATTIMEDRGEIKFKEVKWDHLAEVC